MWHKFKKDLFSCYSKQKVNGVMGVNGIMRTCHIQCYLKGKFNMDLFSDCECIIKNSMFGVTSFCLFPFVFKFGDFLTCQ